jgi:hypothetical protein
LAFCSSLHFPIVTLLAHHANPVADQHTGATLVCLLLGFFFHFAQLFYAGVHFLRTASSVIVHRLLPLFIRDLPAFE